MKKHGVKLGALWLSISLCAAFLFGCGSKNSEEGTKVSQDGGQNESVIEMTEQEKQAKDTFLSEANLYVEPIEGMTEDFIRGMDASAVLACENSGAKYYNYAGEEQDVFQTLAQAGVNYIRIRVWNDPYDENGNGYGGGNNDVATAIELGKRATQYGMKVCIDFHYSDFWADPKRQHTPKAWKGMKIEEKSTALYDFTKESMKAILDAGVDVGMVQIGNEINNGMSGETFFSKISQLLNAGSRAVRECALEYDKEIQIAVHYTNIEDNAEIDSIAENLKSYEVDYDIFALSYYPFWDGTNENMQTVARNIQENYGKKVMIAETSYCYTSEDGDGYSNSFIGTNNLVDGYPATVQGQANMVRDICDAANEVGVIGVFYWEGTWIPVGDANADNSALWEQYGSGWASSYAADYDPDDAGLYYGGCSWDNQAFFDFDGHPLASLAVFQYLQGGLEAPLTVDSVEKVSVSCDAGGDIILPEQVNVVYNKRTENKQLAVTWDEASVNAIDTMQGGFYEVTGKLEDGTEVICQVEINMTNLILNPGFEEADTSMWNVYYNGTQNPTDYFKKAEDAYDGDYSFHFYSEADMDFSLEQEFTNLPSGTYQLSAYSQGGDMKQDAVLELYAMTAEGEKSTPFTLTTYTDWKNPIVEGIVVTDGTLTIGVRMKCNAKSWGTVDDITLIRISD